MVCTIRPYSIAQRMKQSRRMINIMKLNVVQPRMVWYARRYHNIKQNNDKMVLHHIAEHDYNTTKQYITIQKSAISYYIVRSSLHSSMRQCDIT